MAYCFEFINTFITKIHCPIGICSEFYERKKLFCHSKKKKKSSANDLSNANKKQCYLTDLASNEHQFFFVFFLLIILNISTKFELYSWKVWVYLLSCDIHQFIQTIFLLQHFISWHQLFFKLFLPYIWLGFSIWWFW